MEPQLERLIRLQDLDNASERARRRLEQIPELDAALDARVARRIADADAIRERLADCNIRRREIEKELAIVQGRLARYKDQIMEVKTNKEYHALQSEIATAEREVRVFEDRILDRMEEAEALSANLKNAEADLEEEKAAVAAGHRELARERESLQDELQRLAGGRESLLPQIEAGALALFHTVAQRRGQAMAEAHDGHCGSCRVRLRPQMFNEVRRNDRLIQCESCSRILYYLPPAAVSGAAQ